MADGAASGRRSVIRARLERATERAITVTVEGPRPTPPLELTSPDPVWRRPPPNLDFAAVALVQYAASEGCDLHLEGPVTAAQLERLDEYQTIWSVWRPDKFARIRLSADEEAALPEPATGGAVLGFSGGVDAGFALAAHKAGTMGRLNRDIDLGVLVVGWDLDAGDEAALARARRSAHRCLTAYDAELAVVSTNWKEHYCNAWFMAFNTGLTSILHTFSADHSAAVHATDRSYREELEIPPYGSHVAINHLLGNPAFPVVSTGGTHRRLERVEHLRDHPVLLEELRVCYQDDAAGSNCGRCEKCVRTQLELRAVGAPATAFPRPLIPEDLQRARVRHPQLLMHYDAILERLDPDDEWHAPLAEWLATARASRGPQRVRRLARRVEELEQTLHQREAELRDLGHAGDGSPGRSVSRARRRLLPRNGVRK